MRGAPDCNSFRPLERRLVEPRCFPTSYLAVLHGIGPHGGQPCNRGVGPGPCHARIRQATHRSRSREMLEGLRMEEERCLKGRRWSGRVVTNAKAKREAHRPESSYAKKSTTSGRDDTGRG